VIPAFSRSRRVLGGLAAIALVASACSSSGSTPTPTVAPATPSSASGSVSAASPAATANACGTAPVVLNAYFETGFQIPFSETAEFTKQFPNVTFNTTQDQYANIQTSAARLLASDNPPDLIRLPTVVSLVKDNLLKNLDSYATQYGWDKWPASELLQNRVTSTGERGSGSLYAFGLNYSMTGVFYNKKLAAQIGMTTPPATVADFEALLAKAKSAGIQPIMQWNASKSGGGLVFPLQDLMASYGSTQPINDWVFDNAGASIDTSANLTATQHLEQWIKNGYFPSDVNSIEYADANSRFTSGKALFLFNGDWSNADMDKNAPGNVGFFVFPPSTAGGSFGTMASPLQYGIAASAKHADCAAYFFNWVATNATARQINVSIGGSNPGGPADLPVPPAASGSVTNDTLAAGPVIAKANGQMDFIANATGSIYASGWTPQLQSMVGGKVTAADLLKAVQAEYVKEQAQ
jgi:raffinose/stachyose/melibiose transport system substrate-binding protein